MMFTAATPKTTQTNKTHEESPRSLYAEETPTLTKSMAVPDRSILVPDTKHTVQDRNMAVPDDTRHCKHHNTTTLCTTTQ
jgi:hypothetical protein